MYFGLATLNLKNSVARRLRINLRATEVQTMD